MRKILRPKFWSLGTNLGSHWARLAKGLPQIFCHDGFYIVLRVPYNPHRVPFMVDFLFTNIHSGHRCIHIIITAIAKIGPLQLVKIGIYSNKL